MRENKNGYAPSQGLPQALEAIRGEAARKQITSVQDVFVTTGASEAVDLCLTALLNPGEDLLTPCPDYPLYSAVLAKMGITLNPYYLDEENAWQPDLADIKKKITPRTRGIVLINPNNPTGSLCTRKMLEEIAELARRHNLVVFADEIYDKLILDDDPAHRLRRRRSRCPLRHFRRPLEKLSRSRLAHRMGHRQRRSRGRQALQRRHPKTAARPPLRQPSRTIRNQARPRRPARPLAHRLPKVAQPPRPNGKNLQRHPAHQLRFAARRLLRLPAPRHSRCRRTLRQRADPEKARNGSPRLRLRPKARHQTFPDSLFAGRKDAGESLRGDCRVDEGKILVERGRWSNWRTPRPSRPKRELGTWESFHPIRNTSPATATSLPSILQRRSRSNCHAPR